MSKLMNHRDPLVRELVKLLGLGDRVIGFELKVRMDAPVKIVVEKLLERPSDDRVREFVCGMSETIERS